MNNKTNGQTANEQQNDKTKENKMTKKLAVDFNMGIGLVKVSCKKDNDGNVPSLPPEMMEEAKGSFNSLVSLSKKSLIDWHNIGRVVYYYKMTVKAQDFVKVCDTHFEGLNADQRGACWQVYDRFNDVWEWYHKSGVKIMNVRSVWTAFKKHEKELELDKMSDSDKAEAEAEKAEKEADSKIKSLLKRSQDLLKEIRETSGGLSLAEEQKMNLDVYNTMNLVADRIDIRANEVEIAHNKEVKKVA